MDTEFNKSQQCTSMAKRADDILGGLQRSIASRSMEANKQERQIKSHQYRSHREKLRLAKNVVFFCKAIWGGNL